MTTVHFSCRSCGHLDVGLWTQTIVTRSNDSCPWLYCTCGMGRNGCRCTCHHTPTNVEDCICKACPVCQTSNAVYHAKYEEKETVKLMPFGPCLNQRKCHFVDTYKGCRNGIHCDYKH